MSGPSQIVTIPQLESNNGYIRSDDLLVGFRSGNSPGKQEINIPANEFIQYLSSTLGLNNAQILNTLAQLQAAISAFIPNSEKGVPLGVATLGSDGKVPASQLNISGLTIKGTWDATTNTPALTDGTGTAGDFYVVTGGPFSRNLGTGAVTWENDSWIINTGTKYIQNTNNAPIPVLTTNDVNPDPDRQYVSDDVLAALAGTVGSPSLANKFVTDSDPRLNGGVTYVSSGDGRFGPHLFKDPAAIVEPDDAQTHFLVDLGYTNGTAAAKWPKTNAAWAGGINVNTATYADVVLQEMCLEMENGWSTAHFGDKSYWKLALPDGKITLPRYKTNGTYRSTFKSNQFNFLFNGASFMNASGAANTVIFQRMPANHSEAAGTTNILPWIESSFEFIHGVFIGDVGSFTGQKAFYLGATYTSAFEKIHVYDFYRGIDLRFCLGCTVNKLHAVGNMEHALYSDIGSYSGIPSAADSISQVYVTGSRIQIPSGGIGAVYMRGGDGGCYQNGIIELAGGALGTCTYGIKYDNGGNTVAKDYKVQNVHFEGNGVFSEACIHARLQADCTLLVHGCWPQVPSNHLVLLDNAAGSNTVIIRDTPNTSGANYKYRYKYPGSTAGSIGGGGGWVFENTMLQGNPLSAAAIEGNGNVFDMVNYSSPQNASDRIILRVRPR